MVTALETSYAGPGGHLVGLLTHIVGLFSGAFDAFSGALAHLVGLLTHLVGLLTHLVGLLTTKTPPRLFLQPPNLHNNAILSQILELVLKWRHKHVLMTIQYYKYLNI